MGQRKNDSHRALFRFAAVEGHDKIVEELPKALGILLNEKYHPYRSAVPYVAPSGHHTMVPKLLNNTTRVWVKEKDRSHRALPRFAAVEGYDKIVEELSKGLRTLMN